MRILIFGGAFDPPHKGHKSLLSEAIAELSPDVSLVIPSKESPHKVNSKRAFFHRRNMCKTFLECGENVKISSIERWRRGASYTIDTVDALLRRYKGAQLYLLVGTDMLEYFEKWRDYKRLLELCTLVAGSRGGDDLERLIKAADALKKQGGRVIILKNLVREISSTDIRAALVAGGGHPELPEDVYAYIKRFGLYKKL